MIRRGRSRDERIRRTLGIHDNTPLLDSSVVMGGRGGWEGGWEGGDRFRGEWARGCLF